MLPPLKDSFERQFVYLRLSVTERCNFRCVYCLPNGYRGGHDSPELSVEEIRRLTRAFARLGVWKVRLTGGEPTVRKDLLEIAQAVAETPGVRRVALTTNGARLEHIARALCSVGVKAINISLDSLNRDRFAEMTGVNRFDAVSRGVDQALEAGFESVKVNVVLLKDVNDREAGSFLEWIRFRPVSVRFIELMRTGENGEFFLKRHHSSVHLRDELLERGWSPAARGSASGPAVVYRHPQYSGSVGIIAPYDRDFCSSCNRLRVSSRGSLKLCLFGNGDASLRDLLKDDNQIDELVERVRSLLVAKPARHFLKEGNYGDTYNLAAIGG